MSRVSLAATILLMVPLGICTTEAAAVDPVPAMSGSGLPVVVRVFNEQVAVGSAVWE